MSESSTPKFRLVVPITGYTIRKSSDGTEKYVLTGMASNTNIDLHGERMAKSAIIAMEKSLENGPVTINNEHSRDWDADFGEVTRFWSTDNYELMMEAELDPDHYRTKTLIKALNKGKKLGLSIGGAVKTAAREYVEEIGRTVLTFKDVALFHVAIVGSPAVAETWVAPITKSVKDWKDLSMTDLKTKSTDEEQEERDIEATVAAEPEAQPEAADAQEAEPQTEVEETTSVEETKESEVVKETPPDSTTTDESESSQDEAEQDTTADSDTDESANAAETPEVGQTASDEADQAKADTDTQETTTKSDSEEAATAQEPTESAEENTDPDTATTPAENQEASAQKDESPAGEPSAPESAEEEGTSEVAKSAEPILGGYEQANVAEVSVRALTEEFSWAVWSAVYTGEGDERSTDERKAYVAQALSEYSAIVQSVAYALIDNGTTAEAEKSFVIPRAEEVAKSFIERDARVEELTKSLETTQEEVSTLQKSLDDTAAELKTAQATLEERDGALKTATEALGETQKSLDAASTKISTFEARKSYVFDKFAGKEMEEGEEKAFTSPTLNKWLNAA